MTEETTTTLTDDDAPAADETSADAAAVEANEPTEPEKVRWYNRTTGGQTYLDRYVFPALVPLISVAVIIFFVINISRVFISGHGTIATVVAGAITISILVFAAAISAAARMRSQSIAVFVAVCALAVMLAGWIAVGHAQEEHEAEVVACEPPAATLKVEAETNLKFNQASFEVKAGCVEVEYGGAAGHTLTFDAPGPTKPVLSTGGEENSFAWDLKAGNYTIFCDIPGHRAAGMQASVSVK